jgi:hypothetical protein
MPWAYGCWCLNVLYHFTVSSVIYKTISKPSLCPSQLRQSARRSLPPAPQSNALQPQCHVWIAAFAMSRLDCSICSARARQDCAGRLNSDAAPPASSNVFSYTQKTNRRSCTCRNSVLHPAALVTFFNSAIAAAVIAGKADMLKSAESGDVDAVRDHVAAHPACIYSRNSECE